MARTALRDPQPTRTTRSVAPPALVAPITAPLPGHRRRLVWLSMLLDGLMATLALVGTQLLVTDSSRFSAVQLAMMPLLWVALVAVSRGYESRLVHPGLEDLRRVTRAGFALAVVGVLVAYTLEMYDAHAGLLTLVVTTTGLTLVERMVRRAFVSRLRASGRGRTYKVVVAGHAGRVGRVLVDLRRSTGHGFEVAEICHPRDRDTLASVVTRHAADAVIVLPCRHFNSATLRRLGWDIESTGAQLFVATDLVDVAETRATVASVGSVRMLHIRHAELRGARRLVKDCWERAAAAFALVVLSPLLVVLMLAIRLESSGPAIFRQVRVGRNDRPFTMFKLRTMSHDAEHKRLTLVDVNEAGGALFKIRQDPRITRLGRFLRRYSLDEVPQLFNVVLGQMSLVGPRPPLPNEVELYAPDVRRRLAVKPGVTGLWQVSGRSDLPWEEAVRLDLGYVDNWSLGLDLSIVVRTVRAVMGHQGAY